MSRPFKKFLPSVVVKGGEMCVYNTDGKILGGEVMCRVTDEVCEIPMVLIKCQCNIVESEEKLMELIAASNE